MNQGCNAHMMRDEGTADVIAAMYNDGDTKVKGYAVRFEAAETAERFVRSMHIEDIETSLRWIASAVKTTDAANRYGLAQLLNMAADRLLAISRASLVEGNGGAE